MATRKSSALSGDKAQAGISLGCVGAQADRWGAEHGRHRKNHYTENGSSKRVRIGKDAPPNRPRSLPSRSLRSEMEKRPAKMDTAERMSELVVPPHDGEDDSNSTGSDNRRYPSHERVHDLPRRAARLPGCAAWAGLYVVGRAAAQHHTAQEVSYSGGREACILYWGT